MTREKGKNVINIGEYFAKKIRYKGEEGGETKRLKGKKLNKSGDVEDNNTLKSMGVAVQQPHLSQ